MKKIKYIGAILFVILLFTGCNKVCTHNYQSQTTQEASCTEEGLLTFTCTECGDTYTQAIPVLEHVWDQGIVQKDASCTETGILIYSCQNCAMTRSEEIAKIEHTLDSGVVTLEPTCAEPGVKEYTCSVCGAKVTEAIDVLAHNFGEPEITKEANCTEKGERSVICIVCAYCEPYDTVETNSNHIFKNTVIRQATCTDPGEGVDKCTLCGYSQTCTYGLKPHKYGEGTIASHPTCTVAGIRQSSCSDCGHIKEEKIDATGHSWGETGCNSPATCTVCGYVNQQGFGHNYVLDFDSPPSENFAGRRVYICTNCNKTYSEYYDKHAVFDAQSIKNHGYSYASKLGFKTGNYQKPAGSPYSEKSISFYNLQLSGGIPYLKQMVCSAIDRVYERLSNQPSGVSNYGIYIAVGYGQSGAIGSGYFSIDVYFIYSPN